MVKGKLGKSTSADVIAKVDIKPKIARKKSKSLPATPAQISEQIAHHVSEEAPSIEGYELKADQTSSIIAQDESEKKSAAQLSAQELLDKPLEELEKDMGKRDAHNLLKNLKILTAIMLGKNKNKELSRVLNTDKSFMSKQIKDLEEQGLVTREGEGKETKYEVDRFNMMKFLESKVVVKWSTVKKDNAQKSEDSKNGRTEKNS